MTARAMGAGIVLLAALVLSGCGGRETAEPTMPPLPTANNNGVIATAVQQTIEAVAVAQTVAAVSTGQPTPSAVATAEGVGWPVLTAATVWATATASMVCCTAVAMTPLLFAVGSGGMVGSAVSRPPQPDSTRAASNTIPAPIALAVILHLLPALAAPSPAARKAGRRYARPDRYQ